jgi:endonuclease YncB( thermonuclease family)
MKSAFDLSPNSVYGFIVAVLLGMSLFFGINVESRKRQWQTEKKGVEVASGAAVTVVQIIDGDEVSVSAEDGSTFVVRILGIKAFDPKVNDPGLSEVGNAAVRHLEQVTKRAGAVTVEYDEKKMDRAGRLLAYLRADDRDVGEYLVREGHVLAYTRYPFSREQQYLAVEVEAKTRARGLWGIPKATIRAEALKGTWEAQRKDG